jgi:hypothetical protein
MQTKASPALVGTSATPGYGKVPFVTATHRMESHIGAKGPAARVWHARSGSHANASGDKCAGKDKSQTVKAPLQGRRTATQRVEDRGKVNTIYVAPAANADGF